MVNVANDAGVRDAELTAAASPPSSALKARELVTGLPLERLLELPSLRDGALHPVDTADSITGSSASAARVVTRARLLDASPTNAAPVQDLRLDHQLLCVDPSAVTPRDLGSPAAVAALRTAAALVVTRGGGAGASGWQAFGEQVGTPVVLTAAPSAERVVTEVLGALLDQQAEILERVDEAHQILVGVVLAGGGLQDLCQRLAGFLGGATMVTTTDGRLVASAGAEDDLAAALALDCFDRTGRLITEHEPVGIRDPRTGNAGRALVRIVAGQLDHGLLVAFVDRDLTSDDVHLLERAATVAALAITKEQAVSAVEGKYRAEFLRDALSGRAGTPADAVAHASALGWDLDRRLVVVVAETDEDDSRTTRAPEEVASLQQRFARAWIQAVGVRDPRAAVVGFSQEVVALHAVPADWDTDEVMRSVGDVVRVVRGDGGGGRRTFSTGVSRPIDSVADLRAAYEEALSAVSVGRQLHGASALTHFDGLGIFRLLSLIPDSADLRRFVEESLGPLATDDVPDHADLRQTLSVLLDTNLNVAETARTLFFHYNTLRYRIAKLERMLGPFTSDPQLRLKLALALKVHQMRGI
ncbi:CdaR family transcriptional regulator [Phycicoccus sp. Soil748]|uniref:PucR family transcriptional regulator n=1 Tax=Phycicoccus sp. Soil748 TaxID=1736397 RepID=UPI0009E717AB|nr:helix-turn-helix domain-containing protein [Phycicoccus sp. Soil748]